VEGRSCQSRRKRGGGPPRAGRQWRGEWTATRKRRRPCSSSGHRQPVRLGTSRMKRVSSDRNVLYRRVERRGRAGRGRGDDTAAGARHPPSVGLFPPPSRRRRRRAARVGCPLDPPRHWARTERGWPRGRLHPNLRAAGARPATPPAVVVPLQAYWRRGRRWANRVAAAPPIVARVAGRLAGRVRRVHRGRFLPAPLAPPCARGQDGGVVPRLCALRLIARVQVVEKSAPST